MGLRKAVGARRTVARGSRQRRLLERHGIEFVQAEITSIDHRSLRRGSDWMAEQLASRGITSRVAANVARVEAGLIVFEDGSDQPFDLLITVPPHRVREVVSEGGLTRTHGWTAVDAGTLETSHPCVYADGDVTLIPLFSRLPLPKSGVMAELDPPDALEHDDQLIAQARAIARAGGVTAPAGPSRSDLLETIGLAAAGARHT